MARITRKSIERVIRRCITDSSVLSVNPFTKGNINRMFEIKLKGSKKSLILRLYNEDWKAKKEEFIYNDIKAHVDIPVPEVFAVDDSKKLLPNAFMLMSKIDGIEIDKNYRKYGNKKIFRKAGEILGKLHSINFSNFGWIVGRDIRPAFDSWRDFFWYDIETKLTKLKNVPRIQKRIGDIEAFINSYAQYLDIRKAPCLLHKDYHCSHILTKKDEITGIIDVEWAIAGHNENDFMKLEFWTFNRMKNVRKSFFDGYQKWNDISGEYRERKKLYELWLYLNMANISNQLKNREWLRHNIQALNKVLL